VKLNEKITKKIGNWEVVEHPEANAFKNTTSKTEPSQLFTKHRD